MAHTVRCVALFINLTKQAEKPSKDKKLLRAWEKISEAGRVTTQFFKTMAFEDDAEVGAHMEQLRKLIEEEGRFSTALILATVLKIHKDVIAVHGSVNTVSDKLNTIHSLIGEYSSSLGPSRIEQLKISFCIKSEPWNETLRTCAERRVSETGEWLHQHELFFAWHSARAEADQCLAIEAGSKSGKTHLATMTTAYLMRQARQAGSHYAVASYYLDKTSRDLTASAIVRAIAFQLCMQDPAFIARANPLFKKATEDKTTVDTYSTDKFWSEFIVDIASSLPDFACFVILDGLELLAEEQLDILGKALALSQKASHVVRILLTGNAISLKVVSRLLGQSLPTIALASTYPNRSDVALVAEAELARCDLFSDVTNNPELLQFMYSIRDDLVNAVSGDYYLLHSRIRDIRHLLLTTEIKRVLDRADEDRQATIKRNLSNLAVRLLHDELSYLKDMLHFLAVLEILGVPMPHIAVLERYLTIGSMALPAESNNIQSAYSDLMSTDDQGHISLATDEIAVYLLSDPTAKSTDSNVPILPQDRQLDTIKHFLFSTFQASTLKEHGIDEDFFSSRERLQSVSTFVIERNLALARVAIRLIGGVAEYSSTQNQLSKAQKVQMHGLVTLAGKVIPQLVLEIDISKLDAITRNNLAVEIARLFLDNALLTVFWPVDTLAEAKLTWGMNEQYFAAVVRLLKDPAVVQYFERQQRNQSWYAKIQGITEANELKLAVSQLIAERWLAGNSFWEYEDITAFFHWFTILQVLDLEKKDGVEGKFDENRTRGWFTPPNWRKIEAWVTKNAQVKDGTNFDIQKAAILCAFGDKSESPTDLLKPHSHTDWRASAWLAEALSLKTVDDPNYNAAFDAVEECLNILAEIDVDQVSLIKVNDFFLTCIPYWNNAGRDMHIRQRMIQISEKKPGSLSPKMWAETMVQAIRNEGKRGFDFFQFHYDANKTTILETFIRQASNNYMHFALSWTLFEDRDGKHVALLSDAYRNALALCQSSPTIPSHEKESARIRLTFWLGRLNFISGDQSRQETAIELWETLVNRFLAMPATLGLENSLSIITHLCSAYTQKLLKNPISPEADQIISKVTALHDKASALLAVPAFSQDRYALKQQFRVSLCLARLYVARNEATEAYKILKEHAVSAFAMIAQRNDRPLFSIGCLYFASILTVLGEEPDSVVWVWSKVSLHQHTRWWDSDYYVKLSNLGAHPPLDAAVRAKVEAIKLGEEYTFFDGPHYNWVGQIWPDEFHLPTITTMTCEGRACRSTPGAIFSTSAISADPLHIAVGLPQGCTVPPGRSVKYLERGSFRVCRDCMLSKLCIVCQSRLQEGVLPPMGCSQDHDAFVVPGTSDQGGYSYQVTDADMVWFEGESKKWGARFDWRIDEAADSQPTEESQETVETLVIGQTNETEETEEAEETTGTENLGQA